MKLHKLSNGAYITLGNILSVSVKTDISGVSNRPKSEVSVLFGCGETISMPSKDQIAAWDLSEEIATAVNEAAEQEKRDWPLLRGESIKPEPEKEESLIGRITLPEGGHGNMQGQQVVGEQVFMSKRSMEALKKPWMVQRDRTVSSSLSLEQHQKDLLNPMAKRYCINESVDAGIHHSRIDQAIESEAFKALPPLEQSRLMEQRNHMREYLRVLDERIGAFGGEGAK